MATMFNLDETCNMPQIGQLDIALQPRASVGDGHFNGNIEMDQAMDQAMETYQGLAQPSNQNNAVNNQNNDKPQKKKPGRKPKYRVGSDADDSLDENGVALDPERRAKLERNHAAADRARIKKKDEENLLLEQEMFYEDRCKNLKGIARQLTLARDYYRGLLRGHAHCGYDAITMWLDGTSQAESIIYQTMAPMSSLYQVQPPSPGLVYSTGVSPAESFTSETPNVGDFQMPWPNYAQIDITNADSIHDSMMMMDPHFLPQPRVEMDYGLSMSAMTVPPNTEYYENHMIDAFYYQEGEENNSQWYYSG